MSFLYVQNLRKESQLHDALIRAEAAETNLKTAEKTIKLLKEFQDVDEVINSTDDDDVAEYLRTGVWPKTNPKPSDSTTPAAKQPKAGKSSKGSERSD